jgi:hypothetical protein
LCVVLDITGSYRTLIAGFPRPPGTPSFSAASRSPSRIRTASARSHRVLRPDAPSETPSTPTTGCLGDVKLLKRPLRGQNSSPEWAIALTIPHNLNVGGERLRPWSGRTYTPPYAMQVWRIHAPRASARNHYFVGNPIRIIPKHLTSKSRDCRNLPVRVRRKPKSPACIMHLGRGARQDRAAGHGRHVREVLDESYEAETKR